MDKLLLLFGLMRKAGRVEIGDDPATDALRRGEALAVCCAADASDNTIKHFQRAAEGEEIPFMHLRFDKKELGGVFGRETVAVAALTDMGFAARLFEICAEEDAQWKATAEKFRQEADRLIAEQKRRRKEEKDARLGKRPKTAPVAKTVSPVSLPSDEHDEAELPKKPAVPNKNPAKTFKPAFGDKKPAYGSRERTNDRRSFRREDNRFSRKEDNRLSYVSEENPTGKTYGKVYGKAPKSTHVSLGDRRREDALRQNERNGFESRSYGDRKPYGYNKPYGEKKSFGERKSFGQKPFGEKKTDGFRQNRTTYHQGKASRSAQRYADSSVNKRNGGKA